MKIMTESLRKRFAEIGSQEKSADPIVVAKYFLPGHSATWYATEYDPIQGIFFGYVTGLQENAWGFFSQVEMELIRSPHLNLPIEQDLCGEKRLSEHLPELAEEIKHRQEIIEIETKREQQRDEDLER